MATRPPSTPCRRPRLPLLAGRCRSRRVDRGLRDRRRRLGGSSERRGVVGASGTSLAIDSAEFGGGTLLVAGGGARLNEERLAKGGKPLGFLNPWIYQHKEAWTDITKGTNAIGRGGGMSLPYGYNCTKGWDPATGLGTPLFDKMLAAALKCAGRGPQTRCARTNP